MSMIQVVDGDLAVGKDVLVPMKTGSSGRAGGVEKRTDVHWICTRFGQNGACGTATRSSPQAASNAASTTTVTSPLT